MTRAAPAELWTAAIASASDAYTMTEGGVPSPLLMERAALCVSHEVVALRGGSASAVGVLVGPGHNGGDGLAVARQLHGWGVPVAAWMVTPRYGDAVADQRAMAQSCGVPIHEGLPGVQDADRLWVDAMLGTGSRGAPRGAIASALRWLDTHAPTVVAVDLPSGIDPDTGLMADVAVRAACTVTFGRSKPGLHITPGRGRAGRVVVADMGLRPAPGADPREALLDPASVAGALRGLPAGAHKGQRGHLAVVGGGPGTVGAALLAAVAGLRMGAGLVTVTSPEPGLASVLAAARPELMTIPWTSSAEEVVSQATALVVGPGLTTAASWSAAATLYRDDPRPALWDASALDTLALDGAVPAGPRIVTPHPGEAARMLARIEPEAGWTSGRVQASRLAAGRRLAECTGAVVVLKGEGTVVVEPDGRVAIAVSGGPALATAGSGDVLAGVGGALLARGLHATTVAHAAVHIHGMAGERLGEGRGAVALDIAETVPTVVHALLADAVHPRWPTRRQG
ncbi:MAG: NAD(P)H-hydrate dehydratase [Deltaproteobacteria bacterium]|nr:NAD(P)H-hydrate dehydratase [Deltaproteobacteria bacterium]